MFILKNRNSRWGSGAKSMVDAWSYFFASSGFARPIERRRMVASCEMRSVFHGSGIWGDDRFLVNLT